MLQCEPLDLPNAYALLPCGLLPTHTINSIVLLIAVQPVDQVQHGSKEGGLEKQQQPEAQGSKAHEWHRPRAAAVAQQKYAQLRDRHGRA
eukprot:scaffold205365_cov14-Tisochrysis_lutea.AAC.1